MILQKSLNSGLKLVMGYPRRWRESFYIGVHVMVSMTFYLFSFLGSSANWFSCFQLAGLKKSYIGVELMSLKFRGLILLTIT